MQTGRLTIKQTATGYWVVEQDTVQLAGAMTQAAAEAERDLLQRLRDRSRRRVARPRARSRRLAAVRPPTAAPR